MAISDAVDLSAVARVVGVKVNFKDLRGNNILFLPQRIVVVGQGASSATYSTDKRQVLSQQEAGNLYGFGSPIHLAVLQLLPVNGDGVGTIPVTVYPLEDDGSGVAAAGNIAFSGAQTETKAYQVKINNILSESFVIESGEAASAIKTRITAAINAVLSQPMVAADDAGDQTNLTAKWAGTSGNDLQVEIVGEEAGITFVVTQPVGGLVNPDVDDALNQVGDVWEALFINCMEIADTTTLGKFSTFGEGRWGALTRKPMVAFVGQTEADPTAATAIAETRKTDRTNSQISAPGSKDLPFVVAARAVARIAPIANNNPPVNYATQQLTGITAGTDAEQWDYVQRDFAVKRGGSTIEVVDGVPQLSDIVTFYHPAGEPIPAYRYVVDIIKIQTVIFNLNLIFESENWAGKVLIPNDQVTVNRDARKPKDAVAAINSMIEGLGLQAIVSDPETAKESTIAGINDQNPKRLDAATTVQLSGNTEIISVDLNFGFFFGTLPTV